MRRTTRSPICRNAAFAGGFRERMFLFEGPPAIVSRTVSELFYVQGKESAALEVAKLLEPVVGVLKPKEWPGQWDYDVIVVTGTEAGTSPERPVEHQFEDGGLP